MEGNKFAEQILEQSMRSIQTTKIPPKKMTLKRSPLIKNTTLTSKIEIKQTNPISTTAKTASPLPFTMEKKVLSSPEAEKLGEAIRNLGKSLSRDLCQKFIDQLQIRLKRTNLSDDDINQAADLFVKQQRKIAEEASAKPH